MRFQNSSLLRRFPLDGQSTQTQANRFHNVSAQYRKLPPQTLHYLGRVGLHSLAGLVGAVRVAGDKAGSTVNVSGTRPSACTVSCPVTELKAPEASCAIHVSLSAAWK